MPCTRRLTDGDDVCSGVFKSLVLVALLLAAVVLGFGCGQGSTVTQAPPGRTVDAREAPPPKMAEGARQEPAAADFASPTPQPTPVAIQGPTPQPTPTAVPYVPLERNPALRPSRERTTIVHESYACGPPDSYDGGPLDHFLHWTPDGSHLVFDFDENVWVVDREGTRLRSVVDANPGFSSGTSRPLISQYGFHADVSPDGSMVAYATCQYPNDNPHAEEYPRIRYGYEIASIGVDGTMERRLTNNWEFFDSHPAWSPDGTKIAFIRSPSSFQGNRSRARIYTMSADGSGVTDVSGEVDSSLWLVPPAWSPDGGHLAFLAGGRLYTVGSDGSDLRTIAGWARTAPSWSPDGEELAFGWGNRWESRIYTVKADGTELQERWWELDDHYSHPISQVSWSPDGSEFLFVAGGVYVVDADGSGLRRLLDQPRVWWKIQFNPVITNPGGRALAAWSPQGSRIAVYYPRGHGEPRRPGFGGAALHHSPGRDGAAHPSGPGQRTGRPGRQGRRHPGVAPAPAGDARRPGAVPGRRGAR